MCARYNHTYQVLIETYWNVKDNQKLHQDCRSRVLIETYWNVKKSPAAEEVSEPISINRNILECKGTSICLKHLLSCVLIETYWNVKSGEITPK